MLKTIRTNELTCARLTTRVSGAEEGITVGAETFPRAGLRDALIEWPETGRSLLVEGAYTIERLSGAASTIGGAAHILMHACELSEPDALDIIISACQADPIRMTGAAPQFAQGEVDAVLLAALAIEIGVAALDADTEQRILSVLTVRNTVRSMGKLDVLSLSKSPAVYMAEWEAAIPSPRPALALLQSWSAHWAFQPGHRQDHRPLWSAGFALPMARALLAWADSGTPFVTPNLSESEVYLHITGLEEVRRVIELLEKGRS